MNRRVEEMLGYCEKCKSYKILDNNHSHEDLQVCPECYMTIYKTCEECGDEVHIDKAVFVIDHYLCPKCFKEWLH